MRVNNEFERAWKEVVVAQFKTLYYYGIFAERLKKSTKNSVKYSVPRSRLELAIFCKEGKFLYQKYTNREMLALTGYDLIY
jgi:hypothetical protein